MVGIDTERIVIQRRDEHLLGELAVMRIIDREQTKLVAGFGSTTRANTRLQALCRAGLLRRFFQGTVAGGRRALYALSPKGARLVGAPHGRLRYGNDELLASNFFVTHQLRVNSIYCAVRYQPIPVTGVTFIRWMNLPQPITPKLIPDGYFELSTPDGVLGSFLEVDLGHEGSSVWKAKVESYLRYAASGEFTKQFRQAKFRVWVVTNNENRVRFLRNVIRRSTGKLFWLSSFAAIEGQSLWSTVWQRPADDGLKPLI